MIEYKNMNMVFDYQKMKNDIGAFCEAYGFTYSDLDRLAGVGVGNAANVVSGKRNQKMNTWLSLANAMDIDVRTYFVLSE